MKKTKAVEDEQATEAKALAVLAFRNGPLEDLHAGKTCPTCSKNPDFSRISDDEMKVIMQYAVDRLYHLLALRNAKPEKYRARIAFGARLARAWDAPDPLIASEEVRRERLEGLDAEAVSRIWDGSLFPSQVADKSSDKQTQIREIVRMGDPVFVARLVAEEKAKRAENTVCSVCQRRATERARLFVQGVHQRDEWFCAEHWVEREGKDCLDKELEAMTLIGDPSSMSKAVAKVVQERYPSLARKHATLLRQIEMHGK